MPAEEQQLNEFLEWFAQLEVIPLKVRHDFFTHVKEIGGIDLKALAFIENTLDRLSETNDNQIANLKAEWKVLSVTLQVQAQPRLSLKEKIIYQAKQLMLGRVEGFNNTFKVASQTELKEEYEQADADALQVAHLKASLNG